VAPVASAPGRALVFIGFMGAGKSFMAAETAEALGVPKLDSDALLEERLGHSVAREFELHGEASFRAHEEELVCELLDGAGPGSVIALGGGAVLSPRVREALRPHLTVLLEIDPDAAWERVLEADRIENLGRRRAGERPLARDREAFAARHAERRELYMRLANAILPAVDRMMIGDNDMVTPVVAVRALPALRALAAAPDGTRLLWASSESGEYPVLVGRGLLRAGEACDLAEIWPLDRSRSRPFCVTDETVSALYAQRLGSVQAMVTIPPGEANKTLSSAEHVWSALARSGMTRADHIVALGGGVVGDLAGFCAATYQRGVPIVHIPTTLVAQIDSAYGGKTGVDLPAAKNYVGAYHQPAAVLVDPNTLSTLPAAELAAGWVEVLKTALIAGGQLWERVSAAPGCEMDERTIRDCAHTKLAIVAADERDANARQTLNLGHTVGHAIETVTGYTRYRHGEAVGLGLLAALRLSGAEQLRAQVRELLQARDLPVTLGGADARAGDGASVDVDQIVAAIARDKKRLGPGGVPFVLLSAPGEPRIGCEVPDDALRAAVTELIAS
jgi:shikimate kinase/3-dehydroquinate synthase